MDWYSEIWHVLGSGKKYIYTDSKTYISLFEV